MTLFSHSSPSTALTVPSLGKLDNIELSLVLPTYNEGENIQAMVATLVELLEHGWSGKYELIVVDDDSPDLTWKIALELSQLYPQLQVIRRTERRGLSTAVITGWQRARGEILAVIDADLQHPPQVLLALLAEMERGADLAVASRHQPGGGVSQWSLVRRLLSRGAQMLGLLILPEVIGRLSDPMSGFFVVRRQAIANCPLSPVGYKILIEVAARGRIHWLAEVGYVFRERRSGQSKVTWRQYVEYLQHLLKLRLSLSSRFLQFCAVGLTGVGVDMLILFMLTEPSMGDLPLSRSKIIASQLAILNNFFWNDRWTFRDLTQGQKSSSQTAKRLLKFNLICWAGLGINLMLLNIFFNFLHFNTYLANALAIALVTIWNFWFNVKLSWRVTDVNHQLH
ncbi:MULTISPECIES: glycosyltransferase [unclassified Synechocystis]|uniref:glycosyltransferase n=1 Tax=unclassified Synechocystis TaxID=2640012 RepID=UPI000416CEB8|nr:MULTISPECIES: glycosyltransferase [unclassified Synechocystis]AIE75227.1 Dolichol-phosphate mannosyltransferase [Synechocystis sp. PCC 6714]MCT0252975.1 glycosyltransferase [Synechocystis sp. CS-94]